MREVGDFGVEGVVIGWLWVWNFSCEELIFVWRIFFNVGWRKIERERERHCVCEGASLIDCAFVQLGV